MPPSTLARSSRPPSGRYLSFAEREEVALLRAQGRGVREVARRLGRAASTISRELRRNAATRGGGLEYRATDGAVACRAGGAAPEAGEAGHEPGAADVCAGPAGRRRRRSGRGGGRRAGGDLEGPSPRTAAAPALGERVEPAADLPAPAARLPRRRGDADQPRGHLPVALRPRPRRAAARADGLPAHRACAPRAAGAEPRARQVARRARGDDQPAPGGGGRPGGAGALGGGPHPGPAQLRDRHAGGAHDAVHDVAPPAAACRATAREPA